MKTVLLAGGFGTRLSEESGARPKPMVEIGGQPILWHILKLYAAHGLTESVICCGHKGHVIKEYFANYHLRHADATFDLAQGTFEVHRTAVEPWRVTVVDTGEATMTGGRLRRVGPYLGNQTFCMTYGDGLADVNLTRLIAFHRRQGLLATVTVVRPPGRFGAVSLAEHAERVAALDEKPPGDGGYINGGFFVLEPEVLDYIDGDDTVWETGPLQRLARDGQLAAFRHDGFWQPMDVPRDKHHLESLWHQGNAPWKVW
jgi:glucose-1-phosphate cytidylyltransferase